MMNNMPGLISPATFQKVLVLLCIVGWQRGGRALPSGLQWEAPPPVGEGDLDTHLCQFYNETQCVGDKCEGEREHENCTATQAGKRSHCLTVWQLVGEGAAAQPHVRIKGCFLDTVACERAQPCKLHNAKLHLVHCCCQGDMCNLNATFPTALLPSASAPSSVPPPPPAPAAHDEDAGEEARAASGGIWRSGWAWALALGLAVIAVVVGGVGVGGARYRRRRKPPPCTAAAPAPPHHLPSPILLLEVVARGRFGAVWRARMGGGEGEGEGLQVAVKVFGGGEAEASSWAVEREVLAVLGAPGQHPHVLPLVCAEARHAPHAPHTSREYWLVTAWRQHGNLADYLAHHTLSYEQAARLAHTLAMGLAYLHEERLGKPAVAHRDFKSRNVLLNDDLSACIADFGLALLFHPSQPCGDTHGQVGTRRYMSPEVLEGAINFTRDAFLRIDMYACGLVLWEVASRTRLPAPAPAPPPYAPPFSELGAHPSLDEMQEAVVARKLRPHIPQHWTDHPGMGLVCETIEECWDGDAEARLSASCVLERLRPLQAVHAPAPAHAHTGLHAPAHADDAAAPLLAEAMTPD